jgi:hypothetical protein
MSVNLAFYEEGTLVTPYSEGKVPYQLGYYPVFHGETFNATDGEAKNKVIYLKEVHETKDFWYSTAQVSPVETADHQRDPDEDETNEWHVYVAHPVEHAVVAEAIGNGNGVLVEFDLDYKWVKPGSETIYVAAVAKVRNTDYWICYKDGHIKFAVAPGVVALTADYTHGDAGAGVVDVPAANVIEANGDWSWTDVWEIPHGYDESRGVGHEKDGIPVIIRGKVDAGTTDPEGNAVTLFSQRIKVQGWEHNSRY